MAETPEHDGLIARTRTSLAFALHGLGEGLRRERSFRLKMLLACVFIPAALIIQMTVGLHILLVMSVVLVLVTELFHIALCRIAARLDFDRPAQTQDICRIGNAAALIVLVFAVFTWVGVLYLWK